MKNEIVKNDTFAEVKLYNKENKHIASAIIDLEDVCTVGLYKWYLKDNEYVFSSNESIYLHRFLIGESNKNTVDHKDRNKLNNRKSNLRIATQTKQNFNQKIRIDNTSGVRGVRFAKDKGSWHAGISINKERTNLGYFVNFEDAVKARKDAEIKYKDEIELPTEGGF